MSTGILMTIIICGTVLILGIIGAIVAVYAIRRGTDIAKAPFEIGKKAIEAECGRDESSDEQ